VREWKIKERRQIFFKKIRREEQEEAVALTPSELWNIFLTTSQCHVRA
jgi:hypothetical protein